MTRPTLPSSVKDRDPFAMRPGHDRRRHAISPIFRKVGGPPSERASTDCPGVDWEVIDNKKNEKKKLIETTGKVGGRAVEGGAGKSSADRPAELKSTMAYLKPNVRQARRRDSTPLVACSSGHHHYYHSAGSPGARCSESKSTLLFPIRGIRVYQRCVRRTEDIHEVVPSTLFPTESPTHARYIDCRERPAGRRPARDRLARFRVRAFVCLHESLIPAQLPREPRQRSSWLDGMVTCCPPLPLGRLLSFSVPHYTNSSFSIVPRGIAVHDKLSRRKNQERKIRIGNKFVIARSVKHNIFGRYGEKLGRRIGRFIAVIRSSRWRGALE